MSKRIPCRFDGNNSDKNINNFQSFGEIILSLWAREWNILRHVIKAFVKTRKQLHATQHNVVHVYYTVSN